jgi:hypothetical protein
MTMSTDRVYRTDRQAGATGNITEKWKPRDEYVRGRRMIDGVMEPVRVKADYNSAAVGKIALEVEAEGLRASAERDSARTDSGQDGQAQLPHWMREAMLESRRDHSLTQDRRDATAPASAVDPRQSALRLRQTAAALVPVDPAPPAEGDPDETAPGLGANSLGYGSDLLDEQGKAWIKEKLRLSSLKRHGQNRKPGQDDSLSKAFDLPEVMTTRRSVEHGAGAFAGAGSGGGNTGNNSGSFGGAELDSRTSDAHVAMISRQANAWKRDRRAAMTGSASGPRASNTGPKPAAQTTVPMRPAFAGGNQGSNEGAFAGDDDQAAEDEWEDSVGAARDACTRSMSDRWKTPVRNSRIVFNDRRRSA